MSGTTALLASLVAIDSVNPSLVAGAAGEKEIARFVLSWLQDRGIATQAYEAEPGERADANRGPGREAEAEDKPDAKSGRQRDHHC